MASRGNNFRLILTGLVSMLSAAAFCIGTFAWFRASLPVADEDHIVGGGVGLRSYFYDGNGTEENPYEIVSPIHFYNLTRLQNLGVFEKKTYFSVGHIFDESRGYECIMPQADGEVQYTSYLDMASVSEIAMPPIGGEGTPFYGSFDGHNIPIVNLKISGTPEDIGVFGYIASNASVENLVVKDLLIESTGYDSNKSNLDYLFGSEIDDIFAAETEHFIKDGGVRFTNNGTTTDLKNPSGLGATSYSNINSQENISVIDDTDYSSFYFTEYHPTDTPFTYYWRFSTSLIEKRNEGGEERARLNLSHLKDSVEFNSNDVYIDTRISLIASITIDGYAYSRVVQTYLCRIQSNGSTYDEGRYGMKLFCDFVIGDHTNYHHGNNIGFIAGHVDGSLNNCYLYNGTLNLNNGDLTSIKTESQTGLVGEIGASVFNDISPDIALQAHGDTGVMNFSKVYGVIRDNYNIGAKAWGSYTIMNSNKYSYTSYDSKLKDTDGLYRQYLRYDASTSRRFITKYNDTLNATGDVTVTKNNYQYINSVDFLNNQVISDEEGKDRGLGVFKIATNYSATPLTEDNLGTKFADGIGSSRILNGAEPITKVYYSTAEIDHTKFGTNYMWNTSDNQLDNIGAEPSWSSTNTFSPLYQRDFDYIYEMDLDNLSETHGNNYFYNTRSPFLANYFSSRLIDKFGATIKPGNQRFGFMFRSSENEILNGLTSYMPVGSPSSKFGFEENGSTKYYPSNSIVFKIENPNGANVSVVGNGDDITIYGFNSSTSSNDFVKKYTMHSSDNVYQYYYHNNGEGDDLCRYFRYDASSGITDSKAVDRYSVSKDSLNRKNKLFAHIFKLPPGEYCIGASKSDRTANIYFLAAQGQNDGTIGSSDSPMMDSSITNVDFILRNPIVTPKDEQKFSEVSMSIEFNIASGSFAADSSTGDFKIIFDETSGRFVDYLLVLDKKDMPYYIIDNAPYKTNEVYTQRGNSYRGGA
ncbi:MAG: hypothetical protein MJ241_01500 [Bacilli bacterium]|nr:hypothetical protein [Bacilli bacterium]